MSRSDATYRLIFFEAPDDPAAVRDLLCRVTGDHPTDVMQWVARAPVIWNRPLLEAEVRPILDGLFDLEVAAEARRPDAIPNLAPARNVRGGACLPEGFRVTGLRGEPTHWVPWDCIDLIAAGRIDQADDVRQIVPPTWVRAVSTGLNAVLRRPQMIARRQRTMKTPREPVGEVIIVRRDPRIAFRASEFMNYAYLKERLRPAASENFPLFVADLCARAENASVTPSTRALLNRDDAPDDVPLFPSSQALLDYATIQLLLAWYRRDRDASLPTQFD